MVGSISWYLCGDDDEFRILALDGFAHLFYVLIAAGGADFIHVADVQHGFSGEQEHLLATLFLVVVLRDDGYTLQWLLPCQTE